MWSLLFLPDGTLVSGVSTGAVQFWDVRFGTLLNRFTALDAAVLALAASPEGDAVFASGTDAQIVLFKQARDAVTGAERQFKRCL